MPELTDEELINATRRGSIHAAKMLGARLKFVHDMVATADARIGTRLSIHDRLDAAQDALASIWARLASFDESRSLEAWCWGVVLNSVRAVARKALLQRRHGPLGPDLVSSSASMPWARQDAFEGAAFRSGRAAAFLSLLRPAARETVRLKLFDGLTFAEIAARMAVPESTVKARYYRALETMRSIGAVP